MKPSIVVIDMFSPLLVADYILAKEGRRWTPLQVNKLTYISHGFTLAMHGTSLVYEDVEAWQYGPVFPSLYYALRRFKGGAVPHMAYCNTSFNGVEINERRRFLENVLITTRGIINMVLDTYGNESASRLIDLTHKKGTPWSKYYKKNMHGITIPNEEIRNHYLEILHGRS